MANLLYGRRQFGRRIFAGVLGGALAGGSGSALSFPATPGEYAVKVYAADGTKTAEWGSAIQRNPVLSLDFELLETGCGAFNMTLGELPTTAALNYGMRIDIHLFNDAAPWYSGFVIDRPVAGTTETPYKYKGYGFFQQLDDVLVDGTYSGMDPASIAKLIVTSFVEPDTQILKRASKIIKTGYTASKLRFDNIDAKTAIKQLAEFATGYVYGVDEYREFFFRPINSAVNEQARLIVGTHVNTYTPTEDVADLCNYALIQGATLDEGGSNILATVQDAASQAAYGMKKKVLSMPAAVTATDATRWGQQEIGRLKDPKRRAKITGLRLEYPNADGSFNVRRIKPDGKAAITPLDGGAAHEYPITKVKYTISAQGIVATLDLGEQAKTLADWYVKAVRDKSNTDALTAANNVQLKGGSL